METKTVKLYLLDYSNIKTYLIAALFIAGSAALSQLFHFIPQGGITRLPIYLFILIGVYKFGWKAELLTAVLSPIANSLLFGMPPLIVFLTILLKSILLAIIIGWAAHCFNRISLPILLAVVLFYQIAGTSVEWIMADSSLQAIQGFRIGLLGTAMQIVGGHVLTRYSVPLQHRKYV